MLNHTPVTFFDRLLVVVLFCTLCLCYLSVRVRLQLSLVSLLPFPLRRRSAHLFDIGRG